MANGTIAFDTLQTSGQISGTAKSLDTDYVVNGSAKAWINFNGTGTIAARDSFNVTSLTDEGVGAYQTNLTTSLDNANYAVTGSAGGLSGVSGCWHTTGFNVNSYVTDNQTGSFHTQIYYSTSQVADTEFIYSALLGDLA